MTDRWAGKPRIAVSRDLKRRLDELKGASETYEEVLERLLPDNQESGDSASVPADRKIRTLEEDGPAEVVEKTAKEIGNGAHVCVPKKWAGSKVLVRLKTGREEGKGLA